jgi:hypothetical protein
MAANTAPLECVAVECISVGISKLDPPFATQTKAIPLSLHLSR